MYFHSQPSFLLASSSGITGVARNGAEMGFNTPITKEWSSPTLSDGKKFTVSGWFGNLDDESSQAGHSTASLMLVLIT